MKLCCIAGCARAVFARAWCVGHWNRWRRHGSPTAGGPPKLQPLSERLIRLSFHDATSGCRNWTGHTVKGYGRLKIGRERNGDVRSVLAHRCAHEVFIGPIPEGLDVLHHCDNTRCIAPKHLFLGTHADNMKDMVAKGRNSPAKEELNPRAKLSAQDVLSIRAGLESAAELARSYSISAAHVYRIRTGKAWASLMAGTA